MSKIIYLIDQPLDDRNYDRFGIRNWIARGWAIEVWDLTALAHPRAWQSFVESGHELAVFSGYFSIDSSRTLHQRFATLDKAEHYIDLAGDGYWPTRARMRFARRSAVRVSCATGSIPSAGDPAEFSFAAKVRKALREQSLKSLFWRFINTCLKRLGPTFIGPDLFVAAGEKSIFSATHSKEILRAHNLDYDIYLRLQKSSESSAAPYGVFLDQDMCSHPEYIYANVPVYATPEKYFPTLRDGLKEIGIALRAPMRIAAHPRLSCESKYNHHFEGIPVEYGQTAELISKCSFVVCHYTTAVQFAVLFNKPAIFVTTDELNSSAAREYIKNFSASLGKLAVNLDGNLSNVDWPKEMHIDSKKYLEYRRTYIKTDGSPEAPHWDIVIDHLEKSSGLASILNPKSERSGREPTREEMGGALEAQENK